MDGELKEKTFDWYAQDKHGNVWYFGEDTKEFENGKVVSTAGSFEAGKNGARAGIIMRAHPKQGQITPQEYAPGVAEDKGAWSTRRHRHVPFGTFHHCIKPAEFTALEPDGVGEQVLLSGHRRHPGAGRAGGTVHTGLVAVRH